MYQRTAAAVHHQICGSRQPPRPSLQRLDSRRAKSSSLVNRARDVSAEIKGVRADAHDRGPLARRPADLLDQSRRIHGLIARPRIRLRLIVLCRCWPPHTRHCGTGHRSQKRRPGAEQSYTACAQSPKPPRIHAIPQGYCSLDCTFPPIVLARQLADRRASLDAKNAPQKQTRRAGIARREMTVEKRAVFATFTKVAFPPFSA